MRIAIFSDVHSNVDAFNVALKDAREVKNVDKVVCLGDVCGYGPDPLGSIDVVRKNCDFTIMGNHDAGITGKLYLSWFGDTAKNQIVRQMPIVSSDKDKFKWLSKLPYTKKIEVDGCKIEFAHGTIELPDEFEYITCPAESYFAFKKMNEEDVDILFIGHTHEAMVLEFNTREWNDDGMSFYKFYPKDTYVRQDSVFTIDNGKRYIFNAGSIGYPRCQHNTVYCILDTEKRTVEYRFLQFDFDLYVKKMEAEGIYIPRWLDDFMEERSYGAK